MTYRRYRNSSNEVRYITAKFAGKCYGCGCEIKAGAACEYWPAKKAIGHYGAFSGDGDRMGACYSARKSSDRDPGFVDLEQCSYVCGR